MPNLKHLVFVIVTFTSASALGGVVQSVQNFGSLSHGQIVQHEQFYDSGSDTGFRVIGDNFHDDRDWIVAFDTNRNPTRDSDLEAPFSSGNLVNSQGNVDFDGNAIDFFEALIIQEAGIGGQTGLEDTPGNFFLRNIGKADDEGRRRPDGAGSITFDFNRAISSFGVDLLDVEAFDEKFSFVFSGIDAALEPFEVTVGFDEFVTGSFVQIGHEVEFGDHSANRIVPITADKLSLFTTTNIASFDKVTVNLGGSGALDNIRYTHVLETAAQTVPEPTSLVVWLGAFAFVSCVSRRRSATN